MGIFALITTLFLLAYCFFMLLNCAYGMVKNEMRTGYDIFIPLIPVVYSIQDYLKKKKTRKLYSHVDPYGEEIWDE